MTRVLLRYNQVLKVLNQVLGKYGLRSHEPLFSYSYSYLFIKIGSFFNSLIKLVY